jgi:hypothetical protein
VYMCMGDGFGDEEEKQSMQYYEAWRYIMYICGLCQIVCFFKSVVVLNW